MDKKLKAKWVKALRSGKYRRAKGQLQSGRGYCCLGVLCRVARVEFNPLDCFLSDELAEEIRLSRPEQSKLANLNDGCAESDFKSTELPPGYSADKGLGFRGIADYVEKNL